MAIYSHSRLETFKKCPMQYKFQYIDKIKRKEEGIEAFLGSRFHEVMEKIYRNISFKTCTQDELLDFYEDIWNKKYHDKIMIVNTERTAEDYKRIGNNCIIDYYNRYYPFKQAKVLGIERLVTINLDDIGEYKLRGYIDRLDWTRDGIYEIHDYKTGKSLPEQNTVDQDRQLALYQIGVQNMWEDVQEVELVWHYVAFDKEIRSKRSAEDLTKLKKETIDLIRQIEATQEFLPNESALCRWCSYQELCPLFKHQYLVSTLPVNKYLKDSGVKLVNQFAKLDGKKKGYQEKIEKIDYELDKLKEAVIQYAKKKGIEVVIGSDHKLKIKSIQRIIIPRKESQERESLIKMLSQLNKLAEVSGFDANKLKKVIKEDKWDTSVLDKLKKYMQVETVKSVRLSKKNQN